MNSRQNRLSLKAFRAMLPLWCAAALLAASCGGDEGETSENKGGAAVPDRIYKVKRDDLVLGVTASGAVNARKKYYLRMEANLQTKLLWVVDENSHVEEGEVIARFDAENLKTEINNYEVELDNLQKELEVLVQQQEIQVSTDAESIRAAQDRLDTAEDALRKYRRHQLRQSRDDYDAKIVTAEEALVKAKSDYNDYLTESSQTSASDTAEKAKIQQKLESLKNAITTAENNVETAESNRKVFLRYDNPTQIKTLVNNVDQAKLNLEKVKVSINSTAVQQQRQINNMKRRIATQQEELAKKQSYLPMMELKAPVDGVVLYGNPEERWGRTEVKLGMDVYRGMVLMTIPDMRKLIVEFDLPEMYRSKVDTDNKVIITPDSLQGVKLSGVIDSIATLPVNVIFWDSSSPKVYKSKIEVDDDLDKLVSGMSVRIDIVSDILENVLAVPSEAVFEDGDDFFVYRVGGSGPEKQVVKIGENNDSSVQILDGLEEGDSVYLYRPFQKKEN